MKQHPLVVFFLFCLTFKWTIFIYQFFYFLFCPTFDLSFKWKMWNVTPLYWHHVCLLNINFPKRIKITFFCFFVEDNMNFRINKNFLFFSEPNPVSLAEFYSKSYPHIYSCNLDFLKYQHYVYMLLSRVNCRNLVANNFIISSTNSKSVLI